MAEKNRRDSNREGEARRDSARLDVEIAVLRELIQRVSEMAEEERSLKEMLQILEGIGRSSRNLALLLKASQQMEAQAGQNSTAELSMAWQEAIRELTKNC